MKLEQYEAMERQMNLLKSQLNSQENLQNAYIMIQEAGLIK